MPQTEISWFQHFKAEVTLAEQIPLDVRQKLLSQARLQGRAWASMQLLFLRRYHRSLLIPSAQVDGAQSSGLEAPRSGRQAGKETQGARRCPIRGLYRRGVLDLADLRAVHELELNYRRLFAGSGYRLSRWREYVDESSKGSGISAREAMSEEVFRRWLDVMIAYPLAQKVFELAVLEGLGWRNIDKHLRCRNGASCSEFLRALELFQDVRRAHNRAVRHFAQPRLKN